MIRSSLVLKYVNRVPSATPACLDISDVGAAVRPRSANRRVAASRIAFRLSSLLGRATEFLLLLSAYSIIQREYADGKANRRPASRVAYGSFEGFIPLQNLGKFFPEGGFARS